MNVKDPENFIGENRQFGHPQMKNSFLRSKALSDGRKRTVGTGRIGVVPTEQKEGALVLQWQQN